MYLNEILPGNWREDEWPEHIEVSHEASRFKSGVIAQDMTDLDEVTEPQFDILAEDVPTFCPKCGSLLMY